MKISDYIPHGKENRIPRQRLAEITGIRDRDIRSMIKRENAELIAAGEAPILSTSGASGYWRSDDPDEIKRYCFEAMRRSRSIDRDILPFERLLTGSGDYTMVRAHLRRVGKTELDGQMQISSNTEV